MSTKTITCYANAKISTAAAKFGGSSGVLDGSSYFATANNADYGFGTGNFTIDAWINPTSVTSRFAIMGQANDANSNWIVFEVLNNRLAFSCGVNNSNIVSLNTYALTWATGTWYHCAVVKNGSAITLYRDGVAQSIDTSYWYTAYTGASFPTVASELHIGAMGTVRMLNGYIDELRISKGIARWTSAFTPPTAAYNTDANTVLLLHFSGENNSTTIKDNSILLYKSSGNAIFTATGITTTVTASSISWTESKPTGTTLAVSVSTDGMNYSAVTNGNALLAAGTVLNNATIYIKVEMATTDATVTPTLSNLSISLQSEEDRYSIVLEMQPLQRFESAAGNITVAYAGGSLMGEGGPVAAFTQTFSPSDLIFKGDQNDAEHIEMSASAAGTLTRIYYTDTAPQEMGHIEISSVTAVGTLTNVSNI